MLVADALGGGDAGFVESLGQLDVALLFGGAAGHEVSGHIIRMATGEFGEFGQGIVVTGLLGVFHSHGVAQEGVAGSALSNGRSCSRVGMWVQRLKSWMRSAAACSTVTFATS